MIPPDPRFVDAQHDRGRAPGALGTAVLTLLFGGALLAVLWAASNPGVAAAVVGLALAGRFGVRRLKRYRRTRRRDGRTRRLCLPGVDRCVDV